MANIVNRGATPNDSNSDTLYVAFGKLNDAFDTKVDKVTGKALSTNDLSNTLKSNYDTAYSHSQSEHAPAKAQANEDITIEEIEEKLTGNITSHTHDAEREKAQSQVKSIIAKTGNFTLVLADAGAYIRSTASGAITCTVPLNSGVEIPVKSVITIRQAGTGVVTIAPASGVTLNGGLKTGGQHKSLQLIKIDTNVWDVEGGEE